MSGNLTLLLLYGSTLEIRQMQLYRQSNNIKREWINIIDQYYSLIVLKIISNIVILKEPRKLLCNS